MKCTTFCCLKHGGCLTFGLVPFSQGCHSTLLTQYVYARCLFWHEPVTIKKKLNYQCCRISSVLNVLSISYHLLIHLEIYNTQMHRWTINYSAFQDKSIRRHHHLTHGKEVFLAKIKEQKKNHLKIGDSNRKLFLLLSIVHAFKKVFHGAVHDSRLIWCS